MKTFTLSATALLCGAAFIGFIGFGFLSTHAPVSSKPNRASTLPEGSKAIARQDTEAASDTVAGPANPTWDSAPNRPLINGLVYPQGEIDIAAVRMARIQVQQMRQLQKQEAQRARNRNSLPTPTWVQRGPNNIQGRITSIAVDPTDDNIAYVAAAEGGIFKTIDSGATWTPVFDDMPTMSMGVVYIDPTDPNTIYAGTGESNPAAVTYPGTGLYRSTDGGATWSLIGLEDSGRIARIVIHPSDPSTIFVAVGGYVWTAGPDRGVYRSTDSGSTWERVLFVGDQVSCSDIIQRADDPDVLFAGMWERYRAPGERQTGGPLSGVYKSEDGGDTWQLHENGLPTSDPNNGRIGLAISPTDPDVMVFVMTQTSGSFGGCWRTTDGGESWTQTNDESLSGIFSSFGWYFGNVRVNPNDPSTFYIVGFQVARSTDGGATFATIGTNMHVDHHGFAFGSGSNPKIYAGNDGGVYVSTDAAETFTKTTGDLPITQAYRVAIADWDDDALWLGTQDNGSNADVNADGNFNRILGGDGFEVIPHLTDPNRIWAQYQWGNLRFSGDGGASFSSAGNGIFGRTNWDAPHAQDPGDPETRYFGSHVVFRNDSDTDWVQISEDLTNGDQAVSTRFGTLTSIAVSPVDSQVIWAGADDGNVHVTQDGGTVWTDVATGLPTRWIKSLRPHPENAGECLVAISGFQWGEDISHIYRTTNFGQNWTSIGDGLPDIPINDVIYDPLNASCLYAASDLGVFKTDDGGASWGLAGSGMPPASCVDFAYRKNTRELVAGTHGRSIFTMTIPEAYSETLDVTHGRVKSGGGNELKSSDNNDVSLVSGKRIFPLIGLELKSKSPVEIPTSLSFILESSFVARSGATQTLSLFNYQTQAFEVIDSRPARRFNDERITVTPSGDPSRFVEPGTRLTEARIEFLGDKAGATLTANVDQAIWHITP